MRCRVCDEEFYWQSETDPPEYCLCGAMCSVPLWRYDGIRAIKNRVRYKLVQWLYWWANRLIAGGYR